MSFNKHVHMCLFHLIKFNYFYRWTREKIKLLAQGHLTSWMQMESTTGLLALKGCPFPTTKQCLQEATCSSWHALPPSPLKFFSSNSQENWVAEYLILSYFGNTCSQKEIWWVFFFLKTIIVLELGYFQIRILFRNYLLSWQSPHILCECNSISHLLCSARTQMVLKSF